MNILYVIRQRQRALLGVFLVVAGGYFIYSAVFTREYTAFAQVSDYNSRANGTVPRVGSDSPYLAPLRSDTLVKKIAADLKDEDRRRLSAPFTHWLHWGPGAGPVEILLEGRRLTAAEGMVDVGFQHPDPTMAALIANALADEFVRESNAGKDERMHQSLAEIESKITAQRNKTESIRKQMESLSTQYNIVDLHSGAGNVYLATIADLNKQVTQYKTTLDMLQQFRQQALDQAAAKKPLWEVSFISSQPNVAKLIANAQVQSNHVQDLRNQGYQEEAPAMTDAKANVDEAMRELNAGVQSVVAQLAADIQATSDNFTQASKRLDDMKRKNQELASALTVYDGLSKELNTANAMLSDIEVAVSEAETKFNLTDPNYIVLARAELPSSADAKPWGKISLTGLGLGAGSSLMALLGFAMFRPPPKQEREEYERRRRRHRHFHSSRHRSSSSSESSKSSSSRRRD